VQVKIKHAHVARPTGGRWGGPLTEGKSYDVITVEVYPRTERNDFFHLRVVNDEGDVSLLVPSNLDLAEQPSDHSLAYYSQFLEPIPADWVLEFSEVPSRGV
jgi:hypothetical protein